MHDQARFASERYDNVKYIRFRYEADAERYNIQRKVTLTRRRLEPERTTRERDAVQGGRGLRNLAARSWSYGADEECWQERPQGR